MESVPKNWSRKIYFEIPSRGKIVIFITEFVIWGTFMKKRKVVPRMEEFQNYFFKTTFHQPFLAKNCIYRFHFEGKNDV